MKPYLQDVRNLHGTVLVAEGTHDGFGGLHTIIFGLLDSSESFYPREPRLRAARLLNTLSTN